MPTEAHARARDSIVMFNSVAVVVLWVTFLITLRTTPSDVRAEVLKVESDVALVAEDIRQISKQLSEITLKLDGLANKVTE